MTRPAAPPPSSPPRMPPAIWWTLALSMIGAALLVLLLLPPAVGGALLLLAGAGSVALGLRRARNRDQPTAWLARARAAAAQQVRPRMGWRVVAWPRAALELTLLLALALWAARGYADLRAPARLVGGEVQWLTNSVQLAHSTLREHRYIPLWQPYVGKGEPLADSPFGFVFNPLSAGPALLLPDVWAGLRLSVVLYAVVSAWGGWFCARAFGLGGVGRGLLGALMLGNATMMAMIGNGYVQLGVTQAYIPWAIGAALLVVVGHPARWPTILLGVTLALQFLGGNIWHTLPTVIGVGGVALAFSVWPSDDAATRRRRLLGAAGGLALVGLIAVGVAAVVLFPVWAKRGFIGGHVPLWGAGRTVDVVTVLRQFFTPQDLTYGLGLSRGAQETYYGYTLPWWYALGLFALGPLLPWLWPVAGRAHARGMWRVWVLGGALLTLFTLWGLGGLQPFRWLYNTVPGLDRWRFVGRALASATFWLALLAAVRADGLFSALTHHDAPWGVRWRRVLGGVFVLLSVLAALRVVVPVWQNWTRLSPLTSPLTECLAWLRDAEPTRDVAVYQVGYMQVTPYLEQRVRMWPLEADYRPLPFANPSEVPLLARQLPAYATPQRSAEYVWMTGETGYAPMMDSPRILRRVCLLRHPQAVPYAYTLTDEALVRAKPAGSLLAADVYEAHVALRLPDVVAVLAQGWGPVQASVTIQEVAYPGWHVSVDGVPVPLQSVGGQVAAPLPLDQGWHLVVFRYRPGWFVVGAWVTIGTCALLTLALLHVDRWLIRRRAAGGAP